MLLESGAYFGEVRALVRVSEANLAVTEYGRQDQPWHTHENPTLFIHLRGHHLDELPSASIEQPVLSVAFHPTSARHRSRIGPDGMTGLNVELTQRWLTVHGLEESDLGRERLVHTPDAGCAAIKLLEATMGGSTVDSENSLLELAASLTDRAVDSDNPRWLMRALRIGVDRVSEGPTVKRIADEIGVHPVHLTRVFRSSYGSTFTSYLQRARLRYAATLLLDGMTAGEAAAEAGFGDQFYMTRCFQKQFGFAPKRLREIRKLLAA